MYAGLLATLLFKHKAQADATCVVHWLPPESQQGSLTCVRTSLATPLVVFTAVLVVDEATLKVTVCMAAGESLNIQWEAEQKAML